MIDLARLERTYSEVFDGPGAERLKLLGVDEIQQSRRKSGPPPVLFPSPACDFWPCGIPVQEYATGVRKKEDPPFPTPSRPGWPSAVSIMFVRRWVLSPMQYGLLQSLLSA